MKKLAPLPDLLTPAAYARACAAATGQPISREMVRLRIADGTLSTQQIAAVGRPPRAYISTRQHPPGPLRKPMGRPVGRRTPPPAPTEG